MLTSGVKCYHLGCNAIIWDEMLSYGANVVICNVIILDEMLASGANVIIWDEMLHPFFLKTLPLYSRFNML
jgi:hypothetical protein